jgi:G3E family GTPase
MGPLPVHPHYEALSRIMWRTVSSLSRLRPDRSFAADKFQCFLEQLSDYVFRAKGVLWIAESEQRYAFHFVDKRFTLDETRRSAPMKNRLVLIGRKLDQAWLRKELAKCLI